jgi:pimeloyl-ACP methyl ester carboxylesterase
MKTILLLTGLLVGLSGAQAQRNVNWIHGVGSNGAAWQGLATDFNNQRDILNRNTPNSRSYNTANGVVGMFLDILAQNGAGADPNGIAICHSMGGLAARQLDVQYNGRFGRIITFGTPFRGARVITNINNSVAHDYATNASEKIGSGPRAELIGIPLTPIGNLGMRLVDELAGWGLIAIMRNNLGLTSGNIGDLSEESSYNQQFYGNSSGTPKLTYWGNEASPVHIRTVGGENEVDWVNGWNTARWIWGGYRDYNFALRWANIWFYPLYNWRGNQWAKGYNYMYDQSENEWNNLIGAGHYVTQSVTQYEFVGSNFSDYDDCLANANGDANQIQICESTYFQWVTRDVTFFVRDPSDGVVPAPSARGDGTAWTANAEIRELAGINHNEMTKSDAARFEIDQAFGGNRGGNNFFIPTR